MSVYWNDGTSLYHYGIQGMKWGQRRYQNEDGTLTEEGKRRYRVADYDGNRYITTKDTVKARKSELKSARKSKDKESIKAAKSELRNTRKQYRTNLRDAERKVYKENGYLANREWKNRGTNHYHNYYRDAAEKIVNSGMSVSDARYYVERNFEIEDMVNGMIDAMRR